MPRVSKLATAVATILFVLAGVTPAFGATTSWQSIDVISHDEKTQSILLVTGTLSEKTPLPAEVSLSVPAGAELQWVGEVLGGDPSKDPEAKATKSTADGVDVYTFTLTKARAGQIEVFAPPAASDGAGTYSPVLEWTSAQSVPEVRVSARIPSGATIGQQAQGAKLEPGPDGYSYYTKTFTDVKPGDKTSLSFSYTAPQTPVAPQTTPAASSSSAPVILVLLLLVAAGVVFAFAVSRKMRSRQLDDVTETVAVKPVSASRATQSRQAEVDDPDQAEVAEQPVRRKGLSPVAVMIAAIGLLLAIGFVVLGQSGGPQVVDGVLTRSFGGAGACTSTTLTLVPSEGADLGRDGEKLIGSLATVESIGLVTLDVAQSQMKVEFCESTTSEQAIKDTLASTGLVSW